MDPDDNNSTEFTAANQNSVLGETHDLGTEDISETVNGIHGCSMVDVEVLADGHVKTNGPPSLDKLELKESKEAKPRQVQSRDKSEKPSNVKTATRVSAQNTDNSLKAKGISNRRVTTSVVSKGNKLTSATSNTRKDKLRNSEMTSTSGNVGRSEGNVEKLTLKPLQKESTTNSEGDGESVESPSTADAKSQKSSGKLPTYGFSFRCHERAEKRKEFYTKLEERVHAQEIEKNNQQEKSKESQQAELKMLRKSLNFKATPMPTFYQEPPPLKVELKKIPITRPRSPKLGRKKTSSSVEGGIDRNQRPGRLSLDEKIVSQHKPTQAPQRKSLSKLPSEKTRLSKGGPATPSAETPLIAHVTSESVPIAHVDDVRSDPDEVHARLEHEQVTLEK